MTQLATIPKASDQLAIRLGIDRQVMLDTFKAQCFRNANTVSDAQLAAFVSIANDMGVNPLLPGMLYAYPTSGGGIVPMMGPDGVYKKLMEHPAVDSWETTVYPEDVTQPATHAKTEIWLKGRERPISYTALLKEWKVASNPNWNTRERHMLGLRSLKQAARQVIHGLPYDEDDKVIGDLINVTPGAEQADPVASRPPPPKRERGVSASAAEKKASAVEVVAEQVQSKEAKAEPVTELPAAEPVKTATVEVVAEPVKKEEPAPVAATVPEKKAEEPAKPKATEPKKKEPAPVPAKQVETPKVEPITKLNDGQRLVFERIDVQQYAKKTINGKPSIEAEFKGAFTGKAYHIDGAEHPAWQIEKPVTVTLIGKKLTSGAVITLVEKLEVSVDGESVELF